MALAIHVDDAKCLAVADCLRNMRVPPPLEEGDLGEIVGPRIPDFYFLLVAICHQTSPLGGMPLQGVLSNGERWRGRDYLRKRLAERVSSDPTWIDARRWSSITARDLDDCFADAQGSRTLTGVDKRADLIRDLGTKCLSSRIDAIRDLYERAGGYLIGSASRGLLPELAQFSAYSDPVRKKSYFFLELMRNQCGWNYNDPHNLGAPVDYHEVRGHLRIGTIAILDSALLEVMRTQRETSADQDIEIRSAVSDAINLIRQALGTADSSTLHYLFWNVFRNCCQREIQHCETCDVSCGLPDRYRQAFQQGVEQRCVFAKSCTSAGKPDKLVEHRHTTEYY